MTNNIMAATDFYNLLLQSIEGRFDGVTLYAFKCAINETQKLHEESFMDGVYRTPIKNAAKIAMDNCAISDNDGFIFRSIIALTTHFWKDVQIWAAEKKMPVRVHYWHSKPEDLSWENGDILYLDSVGDLVNEIYNAGYNAMVRHLERGQALVFIDSGNFKQM